ncbi:Aste57867_14804 [Aphanomyces stellatus]|uniref:Aste57867_14804 protein n=1 Tax=Aphanomyces stellatus TaxID=120398 RepID=A0A485L2G2_9STRA|nr:hypothetical protein As57867_014749 [Aphanomyces stellatus]VFT91622.1 Aste57867_14804 [Aphanomyces stellatus]
MHQDMDDKTALPVAASMGWANVVEMLLHCVDVALEGVNILDEVVTVVVKGYQPAVASVSNTRNSQRKRVRVLQLFLDHDEVDVNMEDGEGRTVRTRLQDDGVSNDIETLAIALCAHPPLDVYRIHPATGHTMLLWAIHKRLPAVIDALLRRADVSDLGQHHQTCHASFVGLVACASVSSRSPTIACGGCRRPCRHGRVVDSRRGNGCEQSKQVGSLATEVIAARDNDNDEGLHSLTRFLLDSTSIDVNATDSNGLSALLMLQDRLCTAWTVFDPHPYFPVDNAAANGIVLQKLEHLEQTLASGLQVVATRLREVLDLTKATLNQVAKTKEDMLRGIFLATEVHVPTSLVLLPFNLRDTTLQAEDALQETTANKAIGPAIRLVTPGAPLYFYLVDEINGVPVVPPSKTAIYPIEIDTKSADYVGFMTAAMPYIQTGFKLLKGFNTVAGILKTLVVPSLSQDEMTKAAKAIDQATKMSSVFDFDAL